MIELWDGKTFGKSIPRASYLDAMKEVGEQHGYPSHAHSEFDAEQWADYLTEIAKRLA